MDFNNIEKGIIHLIKKAETELPEDVISALNQAYENEKNSIDDKAVSNIYKAIADGDLGTSKWWASMKLGKDFHTTEHQIVKVSWDDANNSTD